MSRSVSTSTSRRLSRRSFLLAAGLGSAALGLLACSQPSAPTATSAPSAAKPTEAPKPASAARTASAARAADAAKPAAAAKPTEAAKPAAQTGEATRRGGELVFVVGAEPDTFDGHKSTTFANVHPIAPHHNTLVKLDPDNFPKIIGNLAESWTTSPDGLTYTFKVRSGVKLHDGSDFSSRDVKATYDRLMKPPKGVVSARRQRSQRTSRLRRRTPRRSSSS